MSTLIDLQEFSAEQIRGGYGFGSGFLFVSAVRARAVLVEVLESNRLLTLENARLAREVEPLRVKVAKYERRFGVLP